MPGYGCRRCGQHHDELPLHHGFQAPAYWYGIPEPERRRRCCLSSDQPVVDGEHFFIVGNLELPVIGSEERFSWDVWVSPSDRNYAPAPSLQTLEAARPGVGTPILRLAQQRAGIPRDTEPQDHGPYQGVGCPAPDRARADRPSAGHRPAGGEHRGAGPGDRRDRPQWPGPAQRMKGPQKLRRRRNQGRHRSPTKTGTQRVSAQTKRSDHLAASPLPALQVTRRRIQLFGIPARWPNNVQASGV
jgi:Uncharacterized protein conserved in bacteria (DUF2199)